MTPGSERGRWLWRWLEWVLPPTPAGRSILGDLIEDHRRRQPGARRTVWLIIGAAQLTAAYLPSRIWPAGVASHPLRGIAMDIRSAFRSLARDRKPAVLAVIALAIGSGSVTAILSVAYGSLLRPLPFPEPETLVVLGDRSLDGPLDQIAGNIALPNVRDVTRDEPTLAAAAAYRDTALTLSGAGDARLVRAQEVETRFFDVVRTPMLLGRSFGPADDGQPVIVLSETVWRQAFHADPLTIGRTVQVDAVPHVIVGVASTLTQLGNPGVWRPLAPTPAMNRRNARQVYAVARLAPGVGAQAAAARLAARFEGLRAAHPEAGASRSIAVTPMRAWLLGREGPRLLYLLSAVVAMVLVIACLNAALLMIVRTENRQRELALRLALGASRGRLLRLLMCEALILALAGAALGLPFAVWATRLIVDLYGPVFPRAWEIELQPPVLAAAMTLAVVTALVISLLPASRLRRFALTRIEGLTRAEPMVRFSQRALIAAQIAIAVVFLVTGSLVVRSVWTLTRQDLGVSTDGVVLFDASLRGRYDRAATARPAVEEMLERLRRVPGVTSAAAATRRPLLGGGNSNFVVPSRPEIRGALVEIRDVTPEYFAALGARVTHGRLLTAADGTSGDAVLVNQAFERRYLPDGAIGQQLRVSGSDRTFTIVGVASDLREFGPQSPARPTVYWAFGNGPYPSSLGLTMIVKGTRRDPLSIVPDARQAGASVDPGIALDNPVSLAELALTRAGRDRLAARTLLMLAASLAVFLTALGLYGVIAFSVATRRREIGIRRALGSSSADVVRIFLWQGIGYALPGVVAGLALARITARGVAAYLYEVTPADPATFGAAAVAVGALTLFASWLPARRAAEVDAAIALLRE